MYQKMTYQNLMLLKSLLWIFMMRNQKTYPHIGSKQQIWLPKQLVVTLRHK